MKKDYYKILGVHRLSSQDEIRKAYRKLAFENHPDKHGGSKAAEEKFKDITEAHDVLSNPERRADYDKPPEADPFGTQGPMNPFRDFGEGFNPLRRRVRPSRGHDIRVRVSISMLESMTGCEEQVSIQRFAACRACNATGDTRTRQCAGCKGTGMRSAKMGDYILNEPCRPCQGTGTIADAACPVCIGSGSRPQSETLTVRLPKGVADGDTLVVRGEGHTGLRGGPSGDIRIEVHVETTPGFTRDGIDLHSEVSVDFLVTLLGGAVSAKNLKDSSRVVLKPCTQPGQEYRLAGEGFTVGNKTGDHVVRVNVRFPTSLTERQRNLLAQWDKE